MKRFLLLCFATLLAGATWAQDFSATTNGVTLYYNIVDSDDYDYACEVAYEDYYAYGYQEVTVPETVEFEGNSYTVVGLGEWAFGEFYSLRRVTLPNTITYFAFAAFNDDWNLEEVNFPTNLKSIGDCVFGTSGIKTAILPEGLTEIGVEAFCESYLETLVLPSSITEMGERAFARCYYLTNLSLTNGLSVLANYAFQECEALTSVSLPASITDVGEQVFAFCPNLSEVTFDEGFTTLGDYMFQNCSSLESVYIPDGLKVFGAWAFQDCSSLESARIPAFIEDMRESAFESCTSLTDVTFGEGFTTLGNSMFYGCSSLTSIELPNTLTHLGEGPFLETGITSLILPESLTTIDAWAFTNMTTLEDIYIPNTITSIGTRAFRTTKALTNVELPENLESMGDYAFAESGLTSIKLPESLESIGQYAFQKCTSLNKVEFLANVETMPSYTFDGCTALETVDLNKYISTIDTYAFRSCTGLRSFSTHNSNPPVCNTGVFENVTTGECTLYVPKGSIEIYSEADTWKGFKIEGTDEDVDGGNPEEEEGKFVYDGIYYQVVGDEDAMTCEVTYKDTSFNTYSGSISVPAKATYNGQEYDVVGIGESAFRYCGDLTDVSFAESITYFDDYAFYNSGGLKEITIPSTVMSIGEYVFSTCGNLANVTIEDSKDSLIATTTVFTDTPILSAYVGRNLSGTPFRDNVSIKSATFGGDMTYITDRSFYRCTALEEVTISGNIKEIGQFAFYRAGIKELTLPEGVETIGFCSFHSCSSLETINFPATTLKYIGSEAFQSCTSLEEVTLPGSVEDLDIMTFDACTGLKKVTFEEGFPYISSMMFVSCSALTDLEIPSTLTTIGSEAFQNCTSLIDISLDGVETIGSRAFSECSNLVNVSLDGVKTIGSRAFNECTKLETISSIESLEYIDGWAFYKCSSLKKITFCENLRYIGQFAFNESGLPEVIIQKVDTIYNYAFRDCGLKYVEIKSVGKIGSQAFSECANLQGAVILEQTEEASGLVFNECSALEVVILGDVANVSNNEFLWCSNLSRVYSLSETPPLSSSNPFLGKKSDAVLYVPVGSTEDYASATGWKDFNYIVEMTPFSVETLEATDVNETSAVMNGTVTERYNEPGSVTSKGFVYWSDDPNVMEVIIIDDEDVEMSYTLNSLTPETTYTYRAFAVTASGTTYGEDKVFTTLQDTTTGINGISLDSENVEGIYSTSGQKLNTTVKGVNIIRYNDGSVKKIYVK